MLFTNMLALSPPEILVPRSVECRAAMCVTCSFYKQNKTNKQNKNRLKETGTKGKLPEKGWGYGNK